MLPLFLEKKKKKRKEKWHRDTVDLKNTHNVKAES